MCVCPTVLSRLTEFHQICDLSQHFNEKIYFSKQTYPTKKIHPIPQTRILATACCLCVLLYLLCSYFKFKKNLGEKAKTLAVQIHKVADILCPAAESYEYGYKKPSLIFKHGYCLPKLLFSFHSYRHHIQSGYIRLYNTS